MKMLKTVTLAAGALLLASSVQAQNLPTDNLTRIAADQQKVYTGKVPDNFTGEVKVTHLFSPESPARAASAMVTFQPGARTVWHTHPIGQILTVTEGCGLVQAEGKPAVTMKPGDVIWIPAHVKHWHGASKNSEVTHYVVTEAKDGSAVKWLEPVSDADYDKAAASAKCD